MTSSLPPKSIILYADDDQDDIELVKEAFNEYANSIELITFDHGEALMDYIYNRAYPSTPCLIILDINMPRKNGKEVLRTLRNMNDFIEVPVILFSTSTLPSERDFAKSFNAGFITKPIHQDQISELVDQMISYCKNNNQDNNKRFKGNQ